MNLSEKEVEAVANVRIKARKDLTWRRKYTIPYYILIVVGLVLCVLPINRDIVLMGSNGNSIRITQGEKVTIDGIQYIRDKSKEWEGLPISFDPSYIGVGILVLSGIIYYKWRYDVKKPYIRQFKEYYFAHGELMDGEVNKI